MADITPDIANIVPRMPNTPALSATQSVHISLVKPSPWMRIANRDSTVIAL